jgi:hypothetical protein
MAQVVLHAPVTLSARGPGAAIGLLRAALVAVLVAACCSLTIALAAPTDRAADDPVQTNGFGSSSPSTAFAGHVAPIDRVPNTSGALELHSVRCASPRVAPGTTCYVAG